MAEKEHIDVKSEKEREYPNSHLIQLFSALLFASVEILDAAIFNFSTRILNFIPILIRGILSVIILGFALLFISKAHQAVFGGTVKHQHEINTLITTGIFAHVRNPMYLGILLLYCSILILTMSLIAFGVWIIIFWLYNKLATFEERILEELFGDFYKKYKQRVSKWIPR